MRELQFPAARTQSRILPRLSGPVAFYFAFPNYGQTLHQAQEIFQQELRGSPVLQGGLDAGLARLRGRLFGQQRSGSAGMSQAAT